MIHPKPLLMPQSISADDQKHIKCFLYNKNMTFLASISAYDGLRTVVLTFTHTFMRNIPAEIKTLLYLL